MTAATRAMTTAPSAASETLRHHFHRKEGNETVPVSMVKKELARVRATAMEGSFGTHKEHYGLKRINGRIKKTEILIIFFGIHMANAVQLAKRIAEAELSQAA